MKKTISTIRLISTICTVVFAWIAGLYAVAAPIVTGSSAVRDAINTTFGLGGTEQKWIDTSGGGVSEGDEDITKVPTAYYTTEFGTIKDLKETAHQVSEDVAAEGSVLLMNKNNALPLAAGNSISMFDVTSVDPVWGGTGSGQATVTGTSGNGSPGAPDGDYNSPNFPLSAKPTFLKSLTAEGFNVNTALWNWYNASGKKRVKSQGWPGSYNTIDGNDWTDIPDSAGKSNPADAAIFVLGRIGGEDYDRKLLDHNETGNSAKSYLQLSTKERSVLDQLKTLRANNTFKKLILIINSSNPPEIDWLTDGSYNFDAALWVGGIGQDGLDAIAGILSGKVNPSGKLPQLYYNKHTDNPVYTNFGRYAFGTGAMSASAGDNSSSYVVYQEGMYLGYRYAETRYEDTVLGTANAGSFDYNSAVAYTFGHGLSYTTFDYTNFKVEKRDYVKKPHKTVNALNVKDYTYVATNKDRNVDKTEYTVTVDVKNTGTKAGKEVVQVYMQRPYGTYDITNKIEKPAVELVGFAKTKELAAGATETVTVKVDEKYFAAFDAYGAGTNVLTPGDYYLAIGKDAHDAVNNILTAKGKTTTPAGTAGLANKTLTLQEANVTKYKYSDTTGSEVKNLFDDADINRYAGKGSNSVTYMSRNNWAGTVKFLSNPTGTLAQQTNQVVLSKTPQMTIDINNNRAQLMDDDIAYPTYGAKNNIMMPEIATRGANGKLRYAYDDPKWQEFLDQLTWNEMVELLSNGKRRTRAIVSVGKPETLDHNGPVGFIHKYGDRSKGDMPANADKWSGFAGLSREGVHKDADGNYVRNDGTTYPYVLDPDRTAYPTAFSSNPVLAATYNIELIERAGEMIGEDGLWGGYNGIYGTGANILRAPHQGRCFEYFSEDGFLSGMIVAYWSRGVQSKGVLVYNKHFALNEQELNRYGVCTFVNEQALREIYLRSFEIPITLGDARAMMGALNRVGLLYAPANKALFTDWLRGETGFQGFTVTDWWDNTNGSDDSDETGAKGYYMQLPQTLVSGNDLPDGELNAAKLNRYRPGGGQESGRLAWAMRESAHRICYAIADSWSVNGWTSTADGTGGAGGDDPGGYYITVQKPVKWPDTVKAWQVPIWIPFILAAAALIVTSVLGFMIKKGKIKG